MVMTSSNRSLHYVEPLIDRSGRETAFLGVLLRPQRVVIIQGDSERDLGRYADVHDLMFRGDSGSIGKHALSK